jgi:hypothetical protein
LYTGWQFLVLASWESILSGALWVYPSTNYY